MKTKMNSTKTNTRIDDFCMHDLESGLEQRNKDGRFGEFGGQFASEILMPAVKELENAFEKYYKKPSFKKKLNYLLKNYAGRPTPLYHAKTFSKRIGCKVYLKREDQVYGGSHKLNNTLGQALLTKRMGKEKIITETAAGLHGKSVAVACNLLDLDAEIFMGSKDIKRQAKNAEIMRLLGADIKSVDIGNGVLKDAVSDTMRKWASCSSTTNYLVGSAVGPHPFPEMVAQFQSVIGREIKSQILEKEDQLPDAVVACGSGGSNAIGAFRPFIEEDVRLYFAEGGGQSLDADNSAAVFQLGSKGVLHGMLTYVLQDEHGQVKPSKTRSAGLNYPARGPEISHLYETGRLNAGYAFDDQVFEAAQIMAKDEGLIPALETAHAIAYVLNNKQEFEEDEVIVINYSGRGDKDMDTILEARKSSNHGE